MSGLVTISIRKTSSVPNSRLDRTRALKERRENRTSHKNAFDHIPVNIGQAEAAAVVR